MTAYLDTSVLALVILQDEGWPAMGAWLTALPNAPTISDFGWGEFVSAVGIRVRSGRIDAPGGDITLAMAAEIVRDWPRVAITPTDVEHGTSLLGRFELGLRLPDALHIAAAHRLGYSLVATDRRQSAAAAAFSYPVINPLEGSLRP